MFHLLKDDQENVYVELGVWHANRVVTKLYYLFYIDNCAIYHHKQNWFFQMYNSHRRGFQQIEPILPRKGEGCLQRLTLLNPHCDLMINQNI